MLVGPERAAGFRVERDDVALRARDVHHAVHDDRRRLDLGPVHLEDPLGLEPVDVVGGDLVQAAVVMAPVVAAVGQPVARLRGGVEQPFVGDRQATDGERLRQRSRRRARRDGSNRNGCAQVGPTVQFSCIRLATLYRRAASCFSIDARADGR